MFSTCFMIEFFFVIFRDVEDMIDNFAGSEETLFRCLCEQNDLDTNDMIFRLRAAAPPKPSTISHVPAPPSGPPPPPVDPIGERTQQRQYVMSPPPPPSTCPPPAPMSGEPRTFYQHPHDHYDVNDRVFYGNMDYDW